MAAHLTLINFKQVVFRETEFIRFLEDMFAFYFHLFPLSPSIV